MVNSFLHHTVGTDGQSLFTDGEFLTIGTDGTDGQCFGGLPYAIAIMLTISFTDGLFKFTDGEFISPSVPTDNLYLPMVNCLTIGTDGTDGQCFRGLPYAIAIILTI